MEKASPRLNFTSIGQVPVSGANWGTPCFTIVSLEPGVTIDVEVTDILKPGYLIVQPSLSKAVWAEVIPHGLARYFSQPDVMEAPICGCLKDGTCFMYMNSGLGVPVRVRLKSRTVTESPLTLHSCPSRTAEVHLIDMARNVVVPVSHLWHLPPDLAVIPPQAALAYWDTSELKDKHDQSYGWTEQAWDQFRTFAMHRHFKARILRARVEPETGRTELSLELIHPCKLITLDPWKRFWTTAHSHSHHHFNHYY